MNNLNSVLLEGNLTAEVNIRETSTGISVATFSIATNRSYKKDDEYVKEVSYFDIEVWGKLAQQCAANLTKGRGVRVVGRLKQDRWENEGQNYSKIKIVAEHVEFKPVYKLDIEDEVQNEN